MMEILAGLLLLTGAALILVAGIGVMRMPDVFIRMHASTKVGTLGSGLIMAGVVVHFADSGVTLKVVMIVLFLLLTAPIGAHMIGRAALRIGIKPWGITRAEVRDTVALEKGARTADTNEAGPAGRDGPPKA